MAVLKPVSTGSARGGRFRASPTRTAPGEPGRIGLVYLAPALAVYGLFVLLPFAHTAYLSFFSWDGIGPKRFVGFENFKAIWQTPTFREGFGHSIELIGFYAVLPIVIALVLVSIMNRMRVRGLTLFRVSLFLPYVVAPTAVAVIWRWVLAPDGPLNAFLTAVGLGALARPWLGDFTFALPSIGVVGTWTMYGLVLVLLLAGAQKIPTELYEACRLDGAGAWWEFRAVTLPGLRNELAVVLVLTVTAALRNFDLVYVMTSGGPGSSTVVPSYLVYQQAFVVGEIGGAAAIGLVLAALITVINVLVGRLTAGDGS
jgi:raffinose/stachyose/melibiose transport system permease protein